MEPTLHGDTVVHSELPCDLPGEDTGTICDPMDVNSELPRGSIGDDGRPGHEATPASIYSDTITASQTQTQDVPKHGDDISTDSRQGQGKEVLQPDQETGDDLLDQCNVLLAKHFAEQAEQMQCKLTADEYLTYYRETDFSSASDSYRFNNKTRSSLPIYGRADPIPLFETNDHAYYLQPDNVLIIPFTNPAPRRGPRDSSGKASPRPQKSGLSTKKSSQLQQPGSSAKVHPRPHRTDMSTKTSLLPGQQGSSTDVSSRPQQRGTSGKAHLRSRSAITEQDPFVPHQPASSQAAMGGYLLDLRFRNVNIRGDKSPSAPKALYGFCLGSLTYREKGHSDVDHYTPFYVFLITSRTSQTIWILSMFDFSQIADDSYDFFDAYWDEKRCRSILPKHPDPDYLNITTKDLTSLPGFELFVGLTAIKIMEADQLGHERREVFQPHPQPESYVCNYHIVPYAVDDRTVRALYPQA